MSPYYVLVLGTLLVGFIYVLYNLVFTNSNYLAIKFLIFTCLQYLLSCLQIGAWRQSQRSRECTFY